MPTQPTAFLNSINAITAAIKIKCGSSSSSSSGHSGSHGGSNSGNGEQLWRISRISLRMYAYKHRSLQARGGWKREAGTIHHQTPFSASPA